MSANPWLSMVRADAELVTSLVDPTRSYWPSPATDFPHFVRAVLDEPKKWKSVVNKYKARAANGTYMDVLEPDMPEVEATFQCTECDKVFSSKNGMHSHMLAKHSVSNPIRLRIYATSCAFCSVQFHSRKRILKHIAFVSVKCRSYYMDNVEPMEIEEVRKLDLACRKKVAAEGLKQLTRPAIKQY